MQLDIPKGLFKTFLDLWSTFRNTFVGVLEFFTQTSIDLTVFGFGDISLLSAMLGTGVFTVLGSWIIRFVKNIIL